MDAPLTELQSRIAEAMLRDQFELRRTFRAIQKAVQEGQGQRQAIARWTSRLEQSAAVRKARQQGIPAIAYPESLPVSARRQEIAEAIAARQVVVVCGETGSGKSTQLPKICLELGRGVGGMIGHTQPRRIAARSVAARVASELGTRIGESVGFKIRFTDQTDPAKTLIKVMTDGVLLAESGRDRFFEQYDTIIVDEAHERSLNIDFLLGMLKRILPKRPELRVIITSATIDAARFAEHFADSTGAAPIIEVEGRTYPVEVFYRPLEEDDADDTDLHQRVADAVVEASSLDRGDMLVFLPTERDIRETARVLRGRSLQGDSAKGSEVLPLYSRLSAEQQSRIFQPQSTRRVVLATNVAESSITVPNIRFVIDSGLARISRYSPRSKMQRLPIESVSRASADQRKGRCGRVGPGVCIRLYSEDDYNARDAYTTPEIQRTNLAAVILQTMALRLGEVERFPFLDAPRPEKIRDGYKTLFEIGAIDAKRQLTRIGKQLSRLPVDPRIARMILAGDEEGCLREILIIASALEIQDPRQRPVEKRGAADEQHAKFRDEQSDFMSYLAIWDFYHDLRNKLSHSRLRKACSQHFLSFERMREWLDVYRQLTQLIEPLKLRLHRRRDDYGAIHRALLTGLLSNIAMRSDKREYTAAGGLKLHLWPGSGLSNNPAEWIVAGELLETSRPFLRTVAKIDPDWIEPIAEHLVKHSYHEPHWRAKRGAAMVYEKTTLFGLPVSRQRPVALAPIDAEQARELFIREGLVEGRVRTRAKFFRENQRLIAGIEEESAKSRSREMMVEPWICEQFYEARLPPEVVDLGSLHRWLKNPRGNATLTMRREDLLPDETENIDTALFPPDCDMRGMALQLSYRFEPGADEDGVTITVPKEGLGRVDERRLGWLVPGLLEEKVLALIRSLPKALRRNFVPAPDAARRITDRLQSFESEGSFLIALARALSEDCGEPIQATDLDESRLPQHLRMNIRVVDDRGRPLASGRALAKLQDQLGVAASEQAGLEEPVVEGDWNRDGLVRWDFEDLPEQVLIHRGAVEVPFYPTLIDRGESVSIRLLDDASASRQWMRGGLRRLFCLAEHKELRSQTAWLPEIDRLRVWGGSLPDGPDLDARIGELIGDLAFFSQEGQPHNAATFEAWRKYGRAEIGVAAQEVAAVVRPLLEQYQAVRLALENAAPRHQIAMDDVRRQVEWLTVSGFLVLTPFAWLRETPRYLQAAEKRLAKLKSGGGDRDARGQAELEPQVERLAHLIERRGGPVGFAWTKPEEIEFRWMVEEFRVSLFAQELGTSAPVSTRRLDKLWAKIEQQAF